MSGQKDDTVSEFEIEAESILKQIVIEQSFIKNRKRILPFIEEYSTICNELINNQQFKSCLFILTKLYNICIEILRNFPKEVDTEEHTRKFFTHLRLKDKMPASYAKEKAVDIPQIVALTKSFIQLPDITQLKNSDHFQYTLVLEHFLSIANNLALINLKRNKHKVTIDYLLTALEAFNHFRVGSFFIKYHLSTVIVNLIYLIEEEYREEASQLLCNVALYLENLEKELDGHPHSRGIYDHMNAKAWSFNLYLNMGNQIFAQRTFKNTKSFFIARMCVVMAYYGDLLDELGRKHEAAVAKEHTKALEGHLIKNEHRRMNEPEESKLTQENVEKRFSSNLQPNRNRSVDEDNYSSTSFKTANTGFSMGTTSFANQTKISKENIIYQKFVEVNDVKFKIIMIHLKELQSLQILLYSKPKNILKKAFVHFEVILDYAKKIGLNVSSDPDPSKLLTKIAKLLYFKNNELLMRDIQYFKTLEELKIHLNQKTL